MASLNVERYSREVIDSYRQNVNHMDHDTARATTIYAASTVAADEGKARVDDAAKLARGAIDSYAKQANDGVPHEAARDKVAQEMASRFDDRGRDTLRHERHQSQGLSL
jgi:hypothetical protein